MKNIFSLFVVVGMLFSASSLWAQSEEVKEDGQKVDGLVFLKSNFINPDGGDDFVSHDLNLYFLVDKKYGFGLDATSCPENNYLSLKPFATVSVGNGLNLVGGLLTTSTGADYVHAGVWYFGSLGEKVKILLDPRFYVEASEEANSYFDGFAEISYPLNGKFTLAFDVAYDYWFESGADWALAGPVVYYQLNDNVSVFTRVARETDFEGGGATDIKVGLKWTF